VQLDFHYELRGWGGFRPGAGRKKQPGSGSPHRKRERVTRHTPVHVVAKLVKGLPSLRRPATAELIEAALLDKARRAEAEGFRILLHSVQSNHLHLILEAPSNESLSRNLKGLLGSLAKRLNAHWGRKGQVFQRYFLRVLSSPRQVRHALVYVLRNDWHHGAPREPFPDRYSSGREFWGWRDYPAWPRKLPMPRSWLMREGWLRHGRISIFERPAH